LSKPLSLCLKGGSQPAMQKSEAAKAAADEWESTYEGGKTVYTEAPFPCIAEIFKTHIPKKSKVLDLGAGYGRDSVWVAEQLGCSVVAVEPTSNGIEQLKKRAESQGVGAQVETVCGTTLEWEHEGGFDAILMDSVLSFVSAEEKPATVTKCLSALRPGAVFIVVSHPEKDDAKWVSKLVEGSSEKSSVEVIMDDAEHPYTMTFEEDGKPYTHNGHWSVTIVKKKA